MSGISEWADREVQNDWEEIGLEEFNFRKKNDKWEREGTDDGHH